jgi:hypothetical protein
MGKNTTRQAKVGRNCIVGLRVQSIVSFCLYFSNLLQFCEEERGEKGEKGERGEREKGEREREGEKTYCIKQT